MVNILDLCQLNSIIHIEYISDLFRCHIAPRPGSLVVERSPGMREVGGSIPGRDKAKVENFIYRRGHFRYRTIVSGYIYKYFKIDYPCPLIHTQK